MTAQRLALAILVLAGACTPPSVRGSAPPRDDIVAPDLYNLFLKEQAELAGGTPEEIARAARTVEIVFRRPIKIDTFSTAFADNDIHVIDSREASPRPLFIYLEDSNAWELKRTHFAPLLGEGDCDKIAATDRTCDTLVLHLFEGILSDGTDVAFRIFGANIQSYIVDSAGNVTTGTGALGATSDVRFSVRDELGDPPELQSYTLRVAGEGGALEGLLEPGFCTFCPPGDPTPVEYLS